jgi:RimJ/RimL family protein N-acetyltransferase
MNLAVKTKTMLLMLSRGEMPEILSELANRLYSDDASYILRRDLARPLVPQPRAQLPLRIRPMEPGDLAEIVAERPRRLPALRANIPTCFVATTETGSICYMQWLIQADQQDRLRPYFKGHLAGYQNDTVLLEFAYTFERFRGQGIMGAAMAEIARQGLLQGARWAITYVKLDNVASLKGCAHAGFRPYMIRRESWRGFRLRQSFHLLEEKALYPFEREPLPLTGNRAQ